MTTTSTLSLSEYYDRLDRHDWYHAYSDDGQVWRRGSQDYKELKAIADVSPEHKALFDAWEAHMWEKAPMPQKPT